MFSTAAAIEQLTNKVGMLPARRVCVKAETLAAAEPSADSRRSPSDSQKKLAPA